MALRAVLLVASLLAVGLTGCIGGGGEDLDPSELPSDVDPVTMLSRVIHDTLMRETLRPASSVDDTELQVDVYRPEGDGPFPTILVQSPYWAFGGDAKDTDVPSTWYIPYFVPRGYAVAMGEMRGTRDSNGCWDFGGELDQMDGHDIVEHLAAQPWSNGKVGMLGQSHVGMSQIAAAITAPEHLTTIVPIAAVSDWYRYLHKAGAPYVVNRATPPAYFAVHASPSTEHVEPSPEAVSPDWLIRQAETVCVDNVVHLSQSAELDGDKDAYWQERDLIAGAANIEASVFLVHGFLDENVKTDHVLDLWQALPDTIEKKAWFGQWYHQHPSFYEWREDLHQWFDFWLKGIENGILDEPRVTVQTSDETARTEAEWPSAGTSTVSLTLTPDGALVSAATKVEAAQPAYLALPGDDRSGPAPTAQLVPGSLTFAGEPVDEAVVLGGQPQLTLDGIIDQPTARWIAVLYDEAPGGGRDEISRAYLDARHRDGWEQGQDVPVGATVTYTLEFFPRDHVLAAGHRLVLTFEGGDLGCMVSTGGSSPCEGTGILPVDRPVFQHVVVGSEANTRLHLPVVTEPGPAKELTELDDWLDDLPE